MNKIHTRLLQTALPLALTLTAVFAAEQALVTKRLQEHTSKSDGKVDLRTETYVRGRQNVLRRAQRKAGDGTWSETRSYFAGGRLLVIEEDKDGDGIFETMLLIDQQHNDLEVFTRDKNGLVAVAPAELREKYQTNAAVMGRFWDKTLHAPDEKALDKLMEDAKKELNTPEKAANPPAKETK
jgi:hypothetical protein